MAIAVMIGEIIDRVKGLDKDRASMEELMFISFVGTGLAAEFDKQVGEQPDWLALRLKEIRREIHTRVADQTERELAKAKLRLAGMRTMDEKRLDEMKKIEELQAKIKGTGA